MSICQELRRSGRIAARRSGIKGTLTLTKKNPEVPVINGSSGSQNPFADPVGDRDLEVETAFCDFYDYLLEEVCLDSIADCSFGDISIDAMEDFPGDISIDAILPSLYSDSFDPAENLQLHTEGKSSSESDDLFGIDSSKSPFALGSTRTEVVTIEGQSENGGVDDPRLSNNFRRDRSLSRALLDSQAQNTPKGPEKGQKSPTKFPCAVCLKKFSRKYDSKLCEEGHQLWKELQKGSGYQAKCDTYKKIFLNKRPLDIHKGTHKQHVDIHKCSRCPKTFARKGHLKLHEIVHMDGKDKSKHGCYFCSRKCSTPCFLRGHLATHTKETPFVCTKCGKGFAENSNLFRHRKAHKRNGGRDFPCGDCSMRFTQMGNLKRHEATVHLRLTPHNCPECHKAFGIKSNLTRHLQTCC